THRLASLHPALQQPQRFAVGGEEERFAAEIGWAVGPLVDIDAELFGVAARPLPHGAGAAQMALQPPGPRRLRAGLAALEHRGVVRRRHAAWVEEILVLPDAQPARRRAFADRRETARDHL